MTGTTHAVTVNSGIVSYNTGIYSVKSYGAIGDGVTDDTAAINLAIAACSSAGGGIVHVPEGTYRTTDTITIANTVRQLEFSAYGARFIADAGIAGPVLQVGTTAVKATMVIINGGRYEIASIDWTDTTGILFMNTSYSRINDVVVYNCEKGIAVKGEAGLSSLYNTIDKFYIYNCKFGIHESATITSSANENTFSHGEIQYGADSDIADCANGYGIYVRTDLGTLKTITGITSANPGIVTSAAHGYSNGDIVYITDIVGMTEANDKRYTVASAATNTFSLGVDTTGYTAYSSAGTIGEATGHPLNNISFYNVSMETSNTRTYNPEANMVDGLNIVFNACRVEGEFPEPRYDFPTSHSTTDPVHNKIFAGYTNSATLSTLVSAAHRLRVNLYGSREVALQGGASTYPVLGVRTNSSGYRGFEVFQGSGDSPTFSVDGNGDVTLAKGPMILSGVNSPEGVVAAPVGSIYLRSGGGAGTTLYIKESGTGNTGWVTGSLT